jgi:catechol 2,3-dioxygenase-like lactoylglutathione lyase family enzyme
VIRGIDHLYIETRSFAKASAFWEGLGFRFVTKWGEDGHEAGLLRCNGASIVLAEADDPFPPTVHFALEGADAFAATLAKKNAVRVTQPLEHTHWGTRWIRVADSDGNVFALEEPKAAPKKRPAAKKKKPSAKKKTARRG